MIDFPFKSHQQKYTASTIRRGCSYIKNPPATQLHQTPECCKPYLNVNYYNKYCWKIYLHVIITDLLNMI